VPAAALYPAFSADLSPKRVPWQYAVLFPETREFPSPCELAENLIASSFTASFRFGWRWRATLFVTPSPRPPPATPSIQALRPFFQANRRPVRQPRSHRHLDLFFKVEAQPPLDPVCLLKWVAVASCPRPPLGLHVSMAVLAWRVFQRKYFDFPIWDKLPVVPSPLWPPSPQVRQPGPPNHVLPPKYNIRFNPPLGGFVTQLFSSPLVPIGFFL